MGELPAACACVLSRGRRQSEMRHITRDKGHQKGPRDEVPRRRRMQFDRDLRGSSGTDGKGVHKQVLKAGNLRSNPSVWWAHLCLERHTKGLGLCTNVLQQCLEPEVEVAGHARKHNLSTKRTHHSTARLHGS